MINLLGISYKNIGPFKNSPLSIFFEQGKFLIKAEIGAGKSFLFFDGPIYGLYKYAGRGMLNNHSKEGFIKLLFEVDGNYFLIVRNLTKGKVKESCATLLYNIEIKDTKICDHGGLQKDIDIQTELKKNPDINIEEVTFKNETDLQQTLNTILPPREVFLNTVFLMQDSDNIFELTPTDRLTVLKNVFNLVGIDEAKDQIANKKKEIWYKLKATADTTKYDDKLKSLLSEYISIYDQLSDEKYKEFDITSFKFFFDELKNLYEKLNITDFSVSDFPIQMNEEIEVILEKNKSEYQKIKHQLQSISEALEAEKTKILGYNREHQELINDNELLQTKINDIDPNKIIKLKEEKKSLQEQELTLQNKIKSDQIDVFYKKHLELWEDFTPSQEPISNAYLFIQVLKNHGKLLNEEVKNIELKMKNEELKVRNSEEKIKDFDEKLKLLDEKIILFDKNTDEQATFDCTKIGSNCPFIKVINKKTFEQLDKQKELLIQEKSDLKLKQELFNKELHIESNKDTKTGLDNERKSIIENIENIKTFLQDIDRKGVEDIYTIFQKIQEDKKNIDNQISALEADLAKLEEFKLQLEKNKLQLENLGKLIKESEEKKSTSESEKMNIETQIRDSDHNILVEVEKNNIRMKEIYRDINTLVNEFKDVQVEVKKLQEEEKIMGNLYTVFSKELLLLVLQDHLPVLGEIINNYLHQVVDYQISFSLHKTSTDKLELLAEIFDKQGKRDVKSLSGGQRVILKIVWMLAISTYIHSPVLFLDETINNLDGDTIGKVADMLEDFVKHRNMKLYAVTHSQQIQEMKFWDKIITLS